MDIPDVVNLVDGFVDLANARVVRAGEEVRLTPNEVGLLQHLFGSMGTVVSQADLLRDVFGYATSSRSRTVVSTVQRLRTKLERDPTAPVHLLTEYGRGYRFVTAQIPRTPAALVGRAEDFAGLHAAVEHGPVLLAGPGGVGKTTLVRAYLHALDAGDFCDLTAVRDLDALVDAVGATLGVPRPTVASVGATLAQRGAALLILDNAEGCIEAAWPEVCAWHAQAPKLRLVVTSRIVPTGVTALWLRTLDADDARCLFERRAQAVDPDFVWAEGPLVERLVAKLAGLPLAIELAAARLALVSVDDLAARAASLLTLLQGRAADGRHGSMNAAVQWSWDHLPADARAVLQACSVFRGGFDLRAAEAVIGAHAVERLADLVRHSMVAVLRTAGGRRFTVLEPIQEFMVALGPPAHEVQARHLAHYVALAAPLELGGAHTAEGRALFVLERANFDAAFAFGVLEEPKGAARLAACLSRLHRLTAASSLATQRLDAGVDAARRAGDPGLLALLLAKRAHLRGTRRATLVALDELDEALSLAPSGPLRGEVLWRRGKVLRTAGRTEEARQDLLESMELLPDAERRQRSQIDLGILELRSGTPAAARGHFERALALSEGSSLIEMTAHGELALLCRREGRLEEAEGHAARALARASEVGDTQNEAILELAIGNLALHRDRRDVARAHFERAMELQGRLGSRVGQAFAWVNLGTLELRDGQLRTAETWLTQALVSFAEAGHHRGQVATLALLAGVHHHADRLADALRVLERAEALRGDEPYPEVEARRALIHAEQGALVDAEAALERLAAQPDDDARAWAAVVATSLQVARARSIPHRTERARALAALVPIPRPSGDTSDAWRRVAVWVERSSTAARA